MRSIALALILLGLTATGALAEMAFKTLDGEVFIGTVTKLEKDGVLFAGEKAESLVKWKRIHPEDRYRLRKTKTSDESAKARFALAKLCLADAYYKGAREELERALVLGHPDSKEIQKLMEQADDRECDGLWAQLQVALDRREFDAALDAIRTMAKRFPNNPHTKAAVPLAGKIVRAKENDAAQAVKDRKDAEVAMAQAKRRKWLDEKFAKTEKWMEAAKSHMLKARAYDEKGNRTRARKGYEGAEENLLAARRMMIRVRRATREGEDFERADSLVRSIERRLLDAYLGLGGMYVGDGNFKRGVIYVDRALLFDPVNPEALRLSERIREKWIRRRMSSITNARPR